MRTGGRWQDVARAVKAAIPGALAAAGAFGEGEVKQTIVRQNIIDTGNLLNSISHEVRGDAVRIGTNVEYGVYVEYGTSRMAAKPWLRATIAGNIGEFRGIFRGRIKSALDGI